MPIRIEGETCYFKVTDAGQERSLEATQVTISTDSDRAMSFVEVNGERIYITEAEADALTVVHARDGRMHLKATASGSVV